MKKKKKNNGMSRMSGPESREEFEHNINLLREEAEHIRNASDEAIGSFMAFTYPGLKKLRTLPNGRIDLNTVDESMRLNANTKNFMRSLGPMELDNEE